MPLHRLNQITVAVPDVGTAGAYYADFGLAAAEAESGSAERVFATADGGDQLRLVPGERRRLVEIRIGADDPDDIDRIAARLARLEIAATPEPGGIRAHDPGTGTSVVVEVTGRTTQRETPAPPYNAPGHVTRPDTRAPGVLREAPVRPRKLGHVVLGSTDQEGSQRFFADGLGFKVSDTVPGLAAFMRCSTDHHNVLVQQAPAAFLHHTAWEVDDVDEVGRGATAMLEGHPERHVWGLGRHHVGSNFFWYLRDPAGNFSEYYSDLDCIVEDALWKPETLEGMRGLYNWGPPPPPSFLAPEDLAEFMTDSHGAAS
ncbi:VOC family protein [Yinghuangia seranimata]|uniref:VOC family protein n=1 Tax=Yinghuangia seranimata TaxID=408067 RepID=UPI00248D2183|nr:VOC family protein [Yinghuangia seranimata]MDI2124747.1 VOC family protein [Yinghuangia seranimata]